MCRQKADTSAQRERGFVLLASLWVMVMLGVLLATLSYQVRVEAALERRFIDQSQLRLAARGAIHTTMAHIKSHSESWHSRRDEWWATETHWRALQIGDILIDVVPKLPEVEQPAANPQSEDPQQDVVFGPVDAESRLNINSATAEQLAALPGMSRAAADDVLQQREQRQQAYDAATRQAEVIRVPQADDDSGLTLVDGPLTSIPAVLTQAGIDLEDEQAALLPDFLTTVSSGKINVNTAAVPVLAAIGLSREAISSITSQRDNRPFESTDALARLVGDADDESAREQLATLDTHSATFRITAHARLLHRDDIYRLEAVVFNDGERLRVVQWIEAGTHG